MVMQVMEAVRVYLCGHGMKERICVARPSCSCPQQVLHILQVVPSFGDHRKYNPVVFAEVAHRLKGLGCSPADIRALVRRQPTLFTPSGYLTRVGVHVQHACCMQHGPSWGGLLGTAPQLVCWLLCDACA